MIAPFFNAPLFVKFFSLCAGILLLTLTASGQVLLAVDGPEWKGVKEYEVKGRNGVLVKHKFSFGRYFTTWVERSWLNGHSSFDVPASSGSYGKIIPSEYIANNKTLFFAFEDSARNVADVYCVTDFQLSTRGNPAINVPAILHIPADKTQDRVFYAQIYTSAKAAPWHLVIDKKAAEESPKTYVTRLARSEDEYYVITPYRTVKNNKGKILEMTFGSAGFQIKNKKGEPVAAVSMINKGMVYLKNLPAGEQIVLASACAALLLEDQITFE